LAVKVKNEGKDTPLLGNTLAYDDMNETHAVTCDTNRESMDDDQAMEDVIQTLQTDNFVFEQESSMTHLTRMTNKESINEQQQPQQQQQSFGECTDCHKMTNGKIYSEDGYDQFYCLQCWSLYENASMSRTKISNTQSNTNITETAGDASQSQSQFDDDDDSDSNSMSTDAALMNTMINPSTSYSQELKAPKKAAKKNKTAAAHAAATTKKTQCLDTPEMEKLTGTSYMDSLDMMQTQILMEEHSDKLTKDNQKSNAIEPRNLDSAPDSMPMDASYLDSLDVLQARYLMQEMN